VAVERLLYLVGAGARELDEESGLGVVAEGPHAIDAQIPEQLALHGEHGGVAALPAL